MGSAAIVCNNVTYVYEDGTHALENVSFTVKYGESVGIIGHNGSGKSTLLMNLIGILKSGGTIDLCGKSLTGDTLETIREHVGYVFQDPRDQLFMSTVYEDVAFGPLNMGLDSDEVASRVTRALTAVGLTGFGNRISYHLSGGEMRRAAIATILAMSPEIILLDEPASGLDPRAKRELTSLLNELACGSNAGPCTILMSSHDLAFVRKCTSRVIMLENGRVVADGPTEEVLGDTAFLESHGL